MDDDSYYAAALAAGRLDIGPKRRRRKPKTTRPAGPQLPFAEPPRSVPSGLAHLLEKRPEDGKPVTFAGASTTLGAIRRTVYLLGYLARFLASDCDRCRDPEDGMFRSGTLTRGEARRRLASLVNVAINRKAGIPDAAHRKQRPEYQVALWRDCRAVRDRVNRRVVVRRFETAEIRRRYGHLLTTDDD